MQLLEYVNLRGERVVFGGVPPYILEHVDGLGLAPIDPISVQGAYQQGETLQRIRRNARTIDARFHIEGRTREDMYRLRAALLSKLTPHAALNEETGEMAKLYYENDYGQWWAHATPTDVRYVERLENFMVSCPLEFRCPNPYWNSVRKSSVVLEMDISAFKLPFTVPFRLGSRNFANTIDYAGQVPTPVEIVIYGTGETPELENRTTGKRISIKRVVAKGEALHIGTDENDLYVNLVQADGTVIPAYGYLTPDSALSEFVLQPGENIIEYLPSIVDQGSRAVLSWYERLEGV